MLIFIIILLVMIFTLRFIVMHKSNRIMAIARKLQTEQDFLEGQREHPEVKKLNQDLKRWLLYSRILNYIKLIAVIISVLGILLASVS